MSGQRAAIAPRHTLRNRVFTLALFGTGAALALMLWSGRSLSMELERLHVQERALRARTVADKLDAALIFELQKLEAVAALAGSVQEDPAAVRAGLHALQRRSGKLFEQLFVIDTDGQVLMAEPPTPATLEDGAALVRLSGTRRRPVFTPLWATADGRARVFVVLPVRTSPGVTAAYLVASLDAASAVLEGLLLSPGLASDASVDLVDTAGVVFASSSRERRFSLGDRKHHVADLIAQRQPISGSCHGCHAQGEAPAREAYALVPLTAAPWGVKVREPVSGVNAVERQVAGSTAVAGLGLVAVMLILAWGTSRAVTRPLESLTTAAERLARGELETPISDTSPDEIGRLGGVLERMRIALRDALQKVAHANEVLEARVQARTRDLARLNVELEKRERARAEALRQALTAQEEERRRIARELHDETSQSLAALAMSLETVSPDGAALARRTLEAVHGLCVNLRPPVLDDLGLTTAIEWCAQKTLAARGVKVRCEFEGLDGVRLPPEVEIAVFRCAQEAMTNIARHARASTVLVQCAWQGGTLTLEVEDDGDGFCPEGVGPPDEKGRGLGLLGMRERVDLLGGTVEVTSAPGEGTRVVMRVPIPKEAEPCQPSA